MMKNQIIAMRDTYMNSGDVCDRVSKYYDNTLEWAKEAIGFNF